jgi:hypothetical protein
MMDHFLLLLTAFLLGQPSPDAPKPYPVPVFAVSCAVLGALIVILDLCYYGINRTSLFDFKYSTRTFPIIFFGWAIGAAITGFLGEVFNVLQVSVLASATAGIGWPAIMIKLIKDKTMVQNQIEDQKAAGESNVRTA